MKKILSIFLSVLLCILLAGCSSGDNSDEAILEQLTEFSTTAVSSEGETEAVNEKETSGQDNVVTEQISSTKITDKDNTSSSKAEEKASAAQSTTNERKENSTVTTAKAATDNTTSPTAVTKSNVKICYITVECKSILDHLDDLKDGHTPYLPKNGYFLNNYKCTYKEGDTAYDILNRACEENNIKLTSKNSGYGVYVVGINNIDERDCGEQSGWLYSVNDSFPAISSDKFSVSPNDKILFTYTCEYT